MINLSFWRDHFPVRCYVNVGERVTPKTHKITSKNGRAVSDKSVVRLSERHSARPGAATAGCRSPRWPLAVRRVSRAPVRAEHEKKGPKAAQTTKKRVEEDGLFGSMGRFSQALRIKFGEDRFRNHKVVLATCSLCLIGAISLQIILACSLGSKTQWRGVSSRNLLGATVAPPSPTDLQA